MKFNLKSQKINIILKKYTFFYDDYKPLYYFTRVMFIFCITVIILIYSLPHKLWLQIITPVLIIQIILTCIGLYLQNKARNIEKIILKMLKDNVSNEQITKYVGVSEGFVKKITEKHKK